ncbi:MAG: ECF transporter S component [Clostridiales bacterium]|nr:ECF transporter S component [Clostridiales bacterium]
MDKENNLTNRGMTTKMMVLNSLLIALTFVATMFINIRLPIMGNGGLIHLGNVPLFIAAFVLGRKSGAIAGGIGMCLFDIVSGWAAWAPFTLVIVGTMGYVAGLIAEKWNVNNKIKYSVAILCACAIKVVGYYFAEVILYGNWVVPLGSIPGNIIQVLVAGAIVLPFAGRLSCIKL